MTVRAISWAAMSLLLLLSASGTSLAAGEVTQFVVAPDGDDAAAGDEAEPFATLHRARDAVRELKAAHGGEIETRPESSLLKVAGAAIHRALAAIVRPLPEGRFAADMAAHHGGASLGVSCYQFSTCVSRLPSDEGVPHMPDFPAGSLSAILFT